MLFIYLFFLLIVRFYLKMIINGPPNGPVLFCSLVSVVCRRLSAQSVTMPAGGRATGRVGGRVADTARRASTITSR